jgi:hypothetical protein
MCDHAGVTFAPDVFEAEFGEFLERADVTMFFSERGPFNLGEILEPPDPSGSNRFVAVVGQQVRTLVIITVEKPFSLRAVFVEEAYASDRTGMDPLFGSGDDRKSERIMTASFTLVCDRHNHTP